MKEMIWELLGHKIIFKENGEIEVYKRFRDDLILMFEGTVEDIEFSNELSEHRNISHFALKFLHLIPRNMSFPLKDYLIKEGEL